MKNALFPPNVTKWTRPIHRKRGHVLTSKSLVLDFARKQIAVTQLFSQEQVLESGSLVSCNQFRTQTVSGISVEKWRHFFLRPKSILHGLMTRRQADLSTI